MQIEDINHLATLSRIRLSEDEKHALIGEFDEILGYVAQINAVVVGDGGKPHAPPHANVMRPDVVTNTPDEYTEALLESAPMRHGRYVKVKKILGETE